jgi:GxxExxY protein
LSEEIYTLSDPEELYGQKDFIYRKETYNLISCCLEVHNALGRGFVEAVYKDALAIEFQQNEIDFEREKKFEISYKGELLPHYYYADFVVNGKIILEVKAQENIIGNHYKQLINYLAASNLKLGLLVNFGENSLKFKRVVL